MMRRTLSAPPARRFRPLHLVTLLMTAIISLAALNVTRAQPSAVIPYDLGETTIIQDQFPPDSRFYNMPVTLRGLLGVPPGDGPFPVALFIHGAYPFCETPLVNEMDVYPCPPEDDLRQYEGFAYLADALAARGYLTVIPDLSAEYTIGYAEPIFGDRSRQMIDLHLNALTTGTGFDLDLTGKADLSQLVIVSHSRGGSLSVLYALDADTAYDPLALVMFTPAAVVQEAILPETMPVAIIAGECDGDVGLVEPQFFVDQLSLERTAPALFYTLPAATHNQFSTRLGPDLGRPCEGAPLLDAVSQQAFASSFTADFFDLVLSETLVMGAG